MRPRIITLDIETVPDARQYARAVGDTKSFDDARRAAEAGDVDQMRELLGESFKPGSRSKPESLLAFLAAYRETWATRLVKGLSVDPTRLAICSWAAYTEDPEPDEHGSVNPTALVCSWGSDGDTVSEIPNVDADGCFVAPTPTKLIRLQTVEQTKPLLEMTDGEQWQAERLLLLNLWGFLGQYAADASTLRAVVATFNGQSFDVPAIQWRTMRHRDGSAELPGVRPTLQLFTPRYSTRPHLDVAQVVWRWERQNSAGCGLVETLNRMGFQFAKGDGMDGAEVYPAACAGEWGRIETYNIGDVITLHDAARMLIEGGMA